MTFNQRVALAIGIFLLDTFFFVIPVVALFSIYIILSRPEWFRDWILKLYGGE